MGKNGMKILTDQPDKQKNDQEQEGLIEAQIDEILNAEEDKREAWDLGLQE